MLGGGPSIGRYIGTDIMGALVGNIVGAWLLGVSFYWFYLHEVCKGLRPIIALTPS